MTSNQPRNPRVGASYKALYKNYYSFSAMKKVLSLLVATAFATTAFAQTTPSTEVKVRDNGTKKIVTERADGSTTVTKTGKTNVGAALDNSTDAAGNLVDKGVAGVKKGFHKGKKATKRTSYKASSALRKDTKKMEKKSE